MNGKNWVAFVAAVDVARDAVGCGANEKSARECYYRGHSSVSHQLTPGLYRRSDLLAKRKSKRDDAFWQIEYDLFYEFRARARELHDRQLDGWDVLFWMQHYGAPTRLLDWTETFAVALYFATVTAKPGTDALMWVLNPYRMNVASIDRDDLIAPEYILSVGTLRDNVSTYEDMLLTTGCIGFDLPIAIYPELKNSRIHSQRGSFTLHGDQYEALDVQLKAMLSAREVRSILRPVTLPYSVIEDAKHFLKLAGTDRALLFPDLASLSQMLRENYGY